MPSCDGHHTSKPLHRPLSSSKRLVRILRPIVEAATDLVPIGVADFLEKNQALRRVGSCDDVNK